MAPETYLVAGERRKVMTLATSRGVPVRPRGWKASKLRGISPCVGHLLMGIVVVALRLHIVKADSD
jgi:hypothetical protein